MTPSHRTSEKQWHLHLPVALFTFRILTGVISPNKLKTNTCFIIQPVVLQKTFTRVFAWILLWWMDVLQSQSPPAWPNFHHREGRRSFGHPGKYTYTSAYARKMFSRPNPLGDILRVCRAYPSWSWEIYTEYILNRVLLNMKGGS